MPVSVTTSAAPLQKSEQSVLSTPHAPGHWVLARLGKKVLRPGGLAATRILLRQISITRSDAVVEFAPGLGLTAQMILEKNPASYTAVERDQAAAARLGSLLGEGACVKQASAEASGLPDNSATRVVGEAMLSMHPVPVKAAIMAEAARVLKTDGLYGIHELVLRPESVAPAVRRELCRAMSKSIHHGVTPLSTREWLGLLEEQGFVPVCVEYVPFRLLNPARLVADEGWSGALKFGWNLFKDKDARKRVMQMRRVFGKYSDHLSAIVVVARKVY